MVSVEQNKKNKQKKTTKEKTRQNTGQSGRE